MAAHLFQSSSTTVQATATPPRFRLALPSPGDVDRYAPPTLRPDYFFDYDAHGKPLVRRPVGLRQLDDALPPERVGG